MSTYAFWVCLSVRPSIEVTLWAARAATPPTTMSQHLWNRSFEPTWANANVFSSIMDLKLINKEKKTMTMDKSWPSVGVNTLPRLNKKPTKIRSKNKSV